MNLSCMSRMNISLASFAALRLAVLSLPPRSAKLFRIAAPLTLSTPFGLEPMKSRSESQKASETAPSAVVGYFAMNGSWALSLAEAFVRFAALPPASSGRRERARSSARFAVTSSTLSSWDCKPATCKGQMRGERILPLYCRLAEKIRYRYAVPLFSVPTHF